MGELRKALEMNSCVMAATIASMRSMEETYQAITEGISTILQADGAELSLWSEMTNGYRSVHRRGSLSQSTRQTVFPLKTLIGQNLGEIRVERRVASQEFFDNDLEIAATFAMRAALAIENALAHHHERNENIRRAA
jgi:hypothetical protein